MLVPGRHGIQTSFMQSKGAFPVVITLEQSNQRKLFILHGVTLQNSHVHLNYDRPLVVKPSEFYLACIDLFWFLVSWLFCCAIKHRVRQTVKMFSFRSVWGWWSEIFDKFFCFANPPTTNWQGVLRIKAISFDSAQDEGCTGRTSKTCTCEWPHVSNYQEHYIFAFHAQLYPLDFP